MINPDLSGPKFVQLFSLFHFEPAAETQLGSLDGNCLWRRTTQLTDRHQE